MRAERSLANVTAALCRVEPYLIKRRRCAAPCPAALRAGRAAPTAPTRRGAPGHPGRTHRSGQLIRRRAIPRQAWGRLPRRISVPSHGRRLKGACGVACDRFATLDPPTAPQGFGACEERRGESRTTKNRERAIPDDCLPRSMARVPEQLIGISNRDAADIDPCVQALATIHQTSGYPTNWPADPARWLTPSGVLHAWIATTSGLPIAGHVILRQLPAGATDERAAEVSRFFVVPAARRQGIALALLQKTIHWAATNELDLVLEVTDQLQAARAVYERAGFRRINTKRADWTTLDGQPVTLHGYARTC